MRDVDNDIRSSLERLTDPPGGAPGMDALWGDLVARRRRRRNRNRALAALPLVLVALLAVGVLSVRNSDDDARSDVAAGGDAPASSESWERLPDAPISARTAAVGIATDDELVVWGGRDDTGLLSDGAAYSFDDRTWTTITGPLSAREDAVAVWTGEEVLVWGGTSTADDGSTANLNDGASWDPETNTWTAFPGHLGAVGGLTGTAWTGEEVVLVGTFAPGLSLQPSDAWAFDPTSGEWRDLEPTPDTSGDDLRGRKAFASGQEVIVATVTNDAEVSVSALDPASGEWTDFPLTWKAEAPVDVDDIVWDGTVLTFVGHDTPGTVFSTTGTGSMSNIPATRSELRLDPVALGDGIVTVGDKWFDTDDGAVDIYDGTWNDPKPVPAGLDGTAITVAHDGKLYAWNGAGFVWTPALPEPSGAGAEGTLRVTNIQVFGNGPLDGGTERAAVVFNEPLPAGDVQYVSDISSAAPAAGMAWTAQGPDGTDLCDSRHSVPEGAVGSVDLLVPASWFADGESAYAGPGLETVDDPAKFPICGPHNGFIQYAMWAPLSADPSEVTVTISPDRTRVMVETSPDARTALSRSESRGHVEKFLALVQTGEIEAAATLWSGYPASEPDRPISERVQYVELLAEYPPFVGIVASDTTTTFVTPSLDNDDGHVVTILGPRTADGPPVAVAFLTGLSGEGGAERWWIQRLPATDSTANAELSDDGYVEPGEQVVVPGLPLEGGVRGFVNGVEVPVEADTENEQFIVAVPEQASGDIALTFVVATPEEPIVRAFAATVR
jgi:Galactose oxidase, central domain